MSVEVASHLESVLDGHSSSPFLFIGSGFSQRYLQLPTWEELLRQFCPPKYPFEYYLTSSDSNLPKCASLIAEDYYKFWWDSETTLQLQSKYANDLKNVTSPLKIAICDYILNLPRGIENEDIVAELAMLRTLNIEGIITTNWDLLLEEIFNGYKVYIGQHSVVSQTPQNIAEIFKIHGCCTDPNSLVLTDKDYAAFKEKQAYLAAKLITIFVEHPVIFIGYSVSDPNIIDLLQAVLKGLGSGEISKLQQNLIFIQRAKVDRPIGVHNSILVVEGVHLPVTQLVCDSFLPIYQAVAKSKLRVPARILRFCKEQLCEIVASKEPSDKLCLLDIDELDNRDDVEFIVGIGVARGRVSEVGYKAIAAGDLFGAVISSDSELKAQSILDHAIPILDTGKNYLPIFKFLLEAEQLLSQTNNSAKRLAAIDRESLKAKNYARPAARELAGKTLHLIVEELPPDRVALLIPHLEDEQLDADALRSFLQQNISRAYEGTYSSYFRKLFCLYDQLVHKPLYINKFGPI